MDPLGTELPRRTTTAWGLALVAAVLTVPCVRTVQAALDESGGAAVGAWAMAIALLLLLVVAPLLLARSVLRRRTYVSDDAVTVTSGGEVRQQITFVDLTQVRVRATGSGRSFRPRENFFLIGHPTVGRGNILVSQWYVTTLRPLLERLAVEVAARPALLRDEVERSRFEHALTTAP